MENVILAPNYFGLAICIAVGVFIGCSAFYYGVLKEEVRKEINIIADQRELQYYRSRR